MFLGRDGDQPVLMGEGGNQSSGTIFENLTDGRITLPPPPTVKGTHPRPKERLQLSGKRNIPPSLDRRTQTFWN